MANAETASARELALRTLQGLSHGRYGNLAVNGTLEHSGLNDADRRLFTALVYGVTERQVTLDFLISRLSDRSIGDMDEGVLIALRMGLYQLIWLDRVPDHAAINETVALVPHKASGFVNAVLRSYLRMEESFSPDGAPAPRENALRTPEGWIARFPVLASDPLRAASVAYGLPEPLVKSFYNDMGFSREKAGAVMGALVEKPPITLRVNPLKASVSDVTAELRAAGLEPMPGLYLPHAIRVSDGAVASLPVHAEGRFFVQDEASQLCVAALDARPGMLVVDVCACPGSKSFGAALDMENEGEIRAFDLHASKLSLIRSGAERLGISIITAAVRDARLPDVDLYGRADRVLCDVPCSGLGVLAKKPDIRHKDLSEAARLPAIQRAILEASARYVKEGGMLVYSTCTLLTAENRDVVASFLSSHPEFEPCDFAFTPLDAGCAHAPIASDAGCAVLTPDENGTDGFFIARMRRIPGDRKE